jgi:hypothetical protein
MHAGVILRGFVIRQHDRHIAGVGDAAEACWLG